MPAIRNNKGNVQFFSILFGDIVKNSDSNNPEAVGVEVKNPITQETFTKYVIKYSALQGRIKKLELREEPISKNSPKKEKQIYVTLDDGENIMKLKMKAISGYGISLINRLDSLCRMSLESNVVTIGSYNIYDNERMHFNNGIYIHVDSVKIPNSFTKENMPKGTEWKKTVFNGKDQWDRTNYLKFFASILKDKLIPHFERLWEAPAPAPTNATMDDVPDTDYVDDEDDIF